jgi:leucyl aminopeptidase
MRSTEATADLPVTTAPAADVATGLLIIPVWEGDDLADLEGLDAATGGETSRARASSEFAGRTFELFLSPASSGRWKAARVALIGAGPAAEFTTDRLRKLATTGALAARQRRVTRLAFLHRGPLDAADAVQAIAEGLTLADFDAGSYKGGDPPPPSPAGLIVARGGREADLQRAADRGRVLGVCSNLARNLANEPSNILTPRRLAERAAALAGSEGLGVEILEESELERLKMGLLLGVARGSAEPPRLIVLRHEPADAPPSPVLGLVGKGITFDTGGISIKPSDGMERMKDDMAGGAAVICALRAIAMLGAPMKVVGVVPAAENMPGGRAIKPGDVLHSASGKTVEVINTDAEGRLLLGDALWYARSQGATHLVDAATLTGACVVALGKITSGLFGAPPDWVEHVRQVALRAGDRCWPMPLFDEYAEQLRSEIADMVNSAGRPAGAITAAMFLKEFTGGLPWAHFDIAGTAWNEEARPYQPKGAVAVGVRTFAELAFTRFPGL